MATSFYLLLRVEKWTVNYPFKKNGKSARRDAPARDVCLTHVYMIKKNVRGFLFWNIMVCLMRSRGFLHLDIDDVGVITFWKSV